VRKAQIDPYALARGDGRGIIRGRDVMTSTRCTGARRIIIMSCQLVDAGFVVSWFERIIEHDLFVNTVQSRQALLCDQRWIEHA